MAKAKFELKNGTIVTIEGSDSEIIVLLDYYNQASSSSSKKGIPIKQKGGVEKGDGEESFDLASIIACIKECDESDGVEKNILNRTSEVDRSLLPLYIVYKHFDNKAELSTGEIAKITKDLSVPVSTAHVSRALSGTAAKYVIGDKVRKRGQAVKYKISRRGFQYIENVISGDSSD